MKTLKNMADNLKNNIAQFQEKQKAVKCEGQTLQQFGIFPTNELIELTLDFNRSVLIFTGKRSPEAIEIPFDRLLYYRYYCQSESQVVSNGNVIGRAFVGNMLFGATGALIGGLTAKEKSQKSNRWFFHLGYTDIYGNVSELIFADLKGKYLYTGSSPQNRNSVFEFYINDIYNYYHGTRTI